MLMLALGLMSKSMLVTVPPLLLLFDFWPLGRWGDAIDLPRIDSAAARPGFGVLLLEKLPLAALAAGACVMTLLTHATAGTGRRWFSRLANAAVSTVGYLVGFFYPLDLAVVYPVPDRGYPTSTVAGAVVVLLAVNRRPSFWPDSGMSLSGGWLVLVPGNAGAGAGRACKFRGTPWPTATCICPASGCRSRSVGAWLGLRPVRFNRHGPWPVAACWRCCFGSTGLPPGKLGSGATK